MTEKKRSNLKYHIIFIFVSGGLFIFLWNAPPETTAFLPHDEHHERFMEMDKKQAEANCTECHAVNKMPLPTDHPQPYRCLFCHKRGQAK